MTLRLKYLVTAAVAALALLGGASSSIAQTTSPVLRSWMSPDIADAWTQGYKGQKTTITIVDDFTSSSKFTGNLGTGSLLYRHGEWTRLEASMIAPLATIKSQSFYSGTTVPLAAGLNVLNLSYGMYARGTYSLSQLGWSAQESSIINYAKNGRAVIVKAAGNDGIAIGSVNAAGNKDFLNLALVGAPSALFVGALTRNGTVANPASLASYSNKAGTNTAVQSHFLVVGVESSKTGLAGTSFAAPIISGYASILGSKFTTATPTQITNQLLNTARKDTLLNYNAATYGMGEASLSRALAPLTIR
ncbi:MAG: S8 family serine peptidase [Devosia sp.]|jgi:hypothetical protein|nr:S8 family serine peptidase [Devosia sp.]